MHKPDRSVSRTPLRSVLSVMYRRRFEIDRVLGAVTRSISILMRFNYYVTLVLYSVFVFG